MTTPAQRDNRRRQFLTLDSAAQWRRNIVAFRKYDRPEQIAGAMRYAREALEIRNNCGSQENLRSQSRCETKHRDSKCGTIGNPLSRAIKRAALTGNGSASPAVTARHRPQRFPWTPRPVAGAEAPGRCS